MWGTRRSEERVAAASEPPRPGLGGDPARLRACLRLLADDAEADRLARELFAAGEPARAARRVLLALRWRAAVARGRGLLRRDAPAGTTDRPLAPRPGLPARGALALALHLGLDLTGEDLAVLFDTSPERIGRDLLRARAVVDPALPAPCAEMADLTGQFWDPVLDTADRVRLYLHLQECPACQASVEAASAVDAALRATIDERLADLPEGLPPRRLWAAALLQAGLPVGVAILVVGLVVLAGVARGALGKPHAPVPLGAAGTPAPLHGWVLLGSSNGGVSAVDLATGQRQIVVPIGSTQFRDRIISVDGGDIFRQQFLSPDRRLVATWIATTGRAGMRVLKVTDLSGATRQNWVWRADAGYLRPAGWLDPSTLLLIQNPAAPVPAREQNLLALDVASGSRRLLYRGPLSEAIAAPDGSMLALVRPVDRDWSGQTIELRPVTPAGLGAPTVTLAHRYVGFGQPDRSTAVWSPDGRRLYLGLIPDDALATAARIDLAAVDRAGRLSWLTHVADGERANPVRVSPDGRRVVYRVDQTGPPYAETAWELSLAGGDPARLPARALDGAAWSPDSRSLLLLDDRPYYLAVDALDQSPGLSDIPLLLAIGQDVSRPVVGSRFLNLDDTLLAWLPASAVPWGRPRPAPTSLNRIAATTLGPVAPAPTGEQIDAASRVSPGGRYVLLTDPERQAPVVRDLGGLGARQLDGAAHELSWLPGDQGLIGVAAQVGRPPSPSRLAIYAPSLAVGRAAPLLQYDYRHLDPAGIGNDLGRRYALPLVAPDDATTAFFVIDDRRGAVALWLVGWDRPARPVAQWVVPPDAIAGVDPVAVWVDQRTLVFAEPASWRDGLPQESRLQRLVLQPAGGVQITPLVTLRARGSDRGLALAGFAPSPDGRYVAERVRRFGRLDATRGVYHSLYLAPAHDLAQPLEVARGEVDAAPSWSPDGRWLAAGVGRRVTLYSADGRVVRRLTPATAHASNPRWIGPDELWFMLADGQRTGIMRVQVAE